MVRNKKAFGLGYAARIAMLTVSILPFGATFADNDAGTIEEIVVTAQRRAEPIQYVPFSVVAQTGADLERAGIVDIRDLGDVVPGLVFITQGPFAQPEIRGVQSTIAQAGADSPIAMYIDGVYQLNQPANVFDLADISQVEVLKGPQGTLFGRNATGGAISIHTIQPSYETKGNVTVDYGYYGDQAKAAVRAEAAAGNH
jgi:iron complex outermembrane receptor protein